MDDLIYRQAAIDALGDEPEVWSGKDEYEQGLNNQWHYDVNTLKALPSVDAVPVVRCKDCKLFQKMIPNGINGLCKWSGMLASEDGYCSRAERKEDG